MSAYIGKSTITVTTIFDGELDATDVFISLIANQVRRDKEKTIDYHENVIYNNEAQMPVLYETEVYCERN